MHEHLNEPHLPFSLNNNSPRCYLKSSYPHPQTTPQFYLAVVEKNCMGLSFSNFSPQLRDKTWEWHGDEIEVTHCVYHCKVGSIIRHTWTISQDGIPPRTKSMLDVLLLMKPATST